MKHFRRWGAVYLLVLLFAGSWLGHFLMMLRQVRDEATTHGETLMWSQFWPEFWSSTFENWQSEWLQLVFQAILLLGAKHSLSRSTPRTPSDWSARSTPSRGSWGWSRTSPTSRRPSASSALEARPMRGSALLGVGRERGVEARGGRKEFEAPQ